MITPADFVAGWNELREAEPALAEDDNSRLRVANAQAVICKNISLGDKQFFLEAGLPWSAEPEVWFGGVDKGLPRIWEVYGPTASWNEAAKDRLAHYFVIGSTQDDDPICLDERQHGRIVVLAHDDYFQSCQLVNSSLMQMAEFLLLFNRP